MAEPLSSYDPDRKGSLHIFIHDNKSVLIQVVAISMLLLLLAPFYMTALVAVIFFAGIKETVRSVKKLPRPKKIIFYSVFYFVLSSVCYLLYWFGSKISDTPVIFTKDSVRQQVFSKFNSFFNSNIESVERWVVKFVPSLDKSSVRDQFMQGVQNLLEIVFNSTLTFFSDLPMFFLQFCFFITVIIWLSHSKAKEFDTFRNVFSKLASKSEIKKIWTLLQDASYQTLISTFLVSLVQAGVLGVTALCLGLPGWPIIFLVAFVFSFFPVVGTLPAAVLGVILAYNQDGVSSALIFTGAGVFTGLVDNFLRAWLMASEDAVTPGSFNFFAIIGGIALFGFAGVLIGPFILTLATLILKDNDV